MTTGELQATDREGGFIALYRQIQSWPLWKSMTCGQRMVVVQLLLEANWKPSMAWFREMRFRVERGEVFTSEESLAKRAQVSRKVVRTALAKLETDGFISLKSGIELVRDRADVGRETGPFRGPAPRIIIIREYDKFQSIGKEAGPSGGPIEAQSGPVAGPLRAPSEPSKPSKPIEQKTYAPKAALEVPTQEVMLGAFAAPEIGPVPSPPKPPRKEPSGPGADCYRHWRDVVWPKLSDAQYPDGKADHALLAEKLKRITPEQMRAAMDRFELHPYWRGQLDLKGFLGHLPKFLMNTGPPVVAKAIAAPSGIEADSQENPF